MIQERPEKAPVRGSPVYLHPCRTGQQGGDGEEKELFIITPTYTRHEQEPDLTRLGQTLMLAGNITWIVVEDSHSLSQRLKNILAKFSSLNIVLTAGSSLIPFIFYILDAFLDTHITFIVYFNFSLNYRVL